MNTVFVPVGIKNSLPEILKELLRRHFRPWKPDFSRKKKKGTRLWHLHPGTHLLNTSLALPGHADGKPGGSGFPQLRLEPWSAAFSFLEIAFLLPAGSAWMEIQQTKPVKRAGSRPPALKKAGIPLRLLRLPALATICFTIRFSSTMSRTTTAGISPRFMK